MSDRLKDWECDVCGVKARIPVEVDEPKHNCRPRGIGDVLAKGLKSVGITKERTSRVKQILTGNDYAECGCKGRQNWLNSLWSFSTDEPEEDNTDIEMMWYSLEDYAALERMALANDVWVWTHPSDETPSLIKSPFFFREESFFGYQPEFSYLASYDLDGIFVDDIYPDGKLTNSEYEGILESAIPVNAVRGTEVSLITGRHPDFRSVTESWFAKNGMSIFRMDMYNGGHGQHELHAKFKAGVYSDLPFHVYIESDPVQAVEIYRLSNKTVICPTEKKVYTNRQSLQEIQKEVGYVD
jgi:hypothetical protein